MVWSTAKATFLVGAPLAYLLLGLASGAPLNCPIHGPAYPKPRRLAEWPTMQAAFRTLNGKFSEQAAGSEGTVTSFSVELWAADDPDGRASFSFHHTARNLANMNSTGVKKVDGDTVYRIGSLTKAYTVFTWLVAVGDRHWRQPIVDLVPELAEIAASNGHRVEMDPIMTVNWKEITVGDLAGQLAGLLHGYAGVGEMTQQFDNKTRAALGFPPISPADIPPCGTYILCNRKQFFEGMRKLPPQYGPAAATVYSDLSFQILAYALEGITGKSFKDVLQDSVLQPLGLNRTYLFKPDDDSVGIIPANASNAVSTSWPLSIGESAPTGNMYSSSSDLSRTGRAILSSKLMTRATTSRWLKPASMTSELIAAVGYPWGVRRIDMSRSPNYKRVTDAYNKAGRIGSYAALLAMLPDFDAGFSVMLAGNSLSGNPTFSWADTMGEVLVPALEQTAREQAQATYGGRYTAVGSGVNSSLEIRTSPDRLGLGVYGWISNGTDMQTVSFMVLSGFTRPTNPSIRLFPSGLESPRPGGGRKVGFRALFEDLTGQATNLMFSTDCGTWVTTTSVVVGQIPLDQFAFNLDANGKVESIEPMALRIALAKET